MERRDKTVIGVIGKGSISERHIKNLRSLHPNAMIVSVSSTGKNNKIIENSDASLTLPDLINLSPKYVIIASPAPFHLQHASVLLEKNIDVLIEKPLSDSIEKSKEFLTKYKSTNNKVFIAYCLRFLPSMIKMKELISNKAFGEIYYIHVNVGQFLPLWRKGTDYNKSVSAVKSLGGGVLLELSHEIDYLCWLFGDLKLLSSNLKTSKELNLDVETIADLQMRNKDNIFINLHMDFIQKYSQRKCELITESGNIIWDLNTNLIKILDNSGERTLFKEDNYDKNLMYIDMLKTFENNNNQTLANIKSSLSVLEIIDKAKKLNQNI